MDRSDLKPLINTAATIGRLWLSKSDVVALRLRLEQEMN